MNKLAIFPNNSLSTRFIAFILLVLAMCSLSSCISDLSSDRHINLYTGFQNPPAEARPFVRWWWNGNKLKTEELDRELEVLKAVGIGGVEINSVGRPGRAPDNDDPAYDWMSDEWIDHLVYACKKSKDLGMITDMIVGTGWPFGGEFLKLEETCQRVVNNNIPYQGGSVIELDENMLWTKFLEKFENDSIYKKPLSKETKKKLFHIRLIPENCSGTDEVIDLIEHVDNTGTIKYRIKNQGNFILSYGFLLHRFRDVSVGAPGGTGPVMDHYKKEVTYTYLARLKKIAERTGIPLSELIRALFCDSIEVAGANWTDGFAELFYKTYDYKLEDWIPFIFYPAYEGYSMDHYDEQFSAAFKDKLKRVRYDYNVLLVETFLNNFTQVFKDFCIEQNVLCRYQAYGTPFLMGMLDGYMIPDIPESNNWMYTDSDMKDSVWQWSQEHGYMIWNMYASAGAHLTGKKITSVESMTNVWGVFKTTLEEIKQNDDMNFITGMNHSILHGFNYSPPDIPFPGWVRFGSYFSEHNPWWEHLHHWVDYNARLSYVFQNSQADKSIAIIGPTTDLWGENGLSRTKFHLEPAYLYKIWEPISQLGYSCEYINPKVLQGAKMQNGTLSYGNMTYDLLVLASIKSIDPQTAVAIKAFVESGGKIVAIDYLPTKSLHFRDAENNDAWVKNILDELVRKYPESFIQLNKPRKLDELFSWTQRLLVQSGISADVVIDQPSKNVYQIHQYTEDEEVYFFTNVNRYESTSFTATFPVDGKYPWVWNPETGERSPYPYSSDPTELVIKLNPLQSLLLVFENEKLGGKTWELAREPKHSKKVDTVWTVVGNRVDGKTFTWKMDELIDFSESSDTIQSTFGGKIIYKTTISNTGGFTHLDLGKVNEGVTELYVNGQKIGTRWYGPAIYPIADVLKQGNNDIEIHYTTVLANYCKTLENNTFAQYWSSLYIWKEPAKTGIEGPLQLKSY